MSIWSSIFSSWVQKFNGLQLGRRESGVLKKLSKLDNEPSFGRHALIVERKAKKKIKEKLVIILLYFICSISLFLFLRSPLFTIQEISVEGLEKLSLDEV